jgi:arginyl-tRNA synthetase
VVSGYRELSLARLALVDAVRQVISNGLAMLGISAPEKM